MAAAERPSLWINMRTPAHLHTRYINTAHICQTLLRLKKHSDRHTDNRKHNQSMAIARGSNPRATPRSHLMRHPCGSLRALIIMSSCRSAAGPLSTAPPPAGRIQAKFLHSRRTAAHPFSSLPQCAAPARCPQCCPAAHSAAQQALASQAVSAVGSPANRQSLSLPHPPVQRSPSEHR